MLSRNGDIRPRPSNAKATATRPPASGTPARAGRGRCSPAHRGIRPRRGPPPHEGDVSPWRGKRPGPDAASVWVMTTTTSPPHTRSRLQGWAALTSVLITALGLAWWFGDVLWRFDSGTSRGDTSLLSLVPQRVVAAISGTLGALGVAAAMARPGRESRSHRRRADCRVRRPGRRHERPCAARLPHRTRVSPVARGLPRLGSESQQGGRDRAGKLVLIAAAALTLERSDRRGLASGPSAPAWRRASATTPCGTSSSRSSLMHGLRLGDTASVPYVDSVVRAKPAVASTMRGSPSGGGSRSPCSRRPARCPTACSA